MDIRKHLEEEQIMESASDFVKRRKREMLEIENAQIIWKNFAGEPDKFHTKGGYRNFNVVIEDPELAQQMADDGWNVKIRAPREEGEKPLNTLEVCVSFENYPPKVVMVTSRNKVELDEESVRCLDTADILSADLIISPYHYDVNGKQGIKAYLKTAYITIEEDRFAEKYDK